MSLFGFKRRARSTPLEDPSAADQSIRTTADTSHKNVNAGRQPGASLVVVGLQSLQIVLGFLILGLVAYAEHVYGNTFLRSAYVPALVAAVLTIVVTTSRTLFAALGGSPLESRPLPVAGTDVFFALLWLAITVELAAYSDVSAPKEITYYGAIGAEPVDGAYDTYAGTLRKLERAWRCGAAAAAFAGVEFVLFLVTAALALHHAYGGHLGTGTSGPAYRQDGAGVPTGNRDSGTLSGSAPLAPEARSTAEPGYEMRDTSDGEGAGEGRMAGQSHWERFTAGKTEGA